ncbi:siderochrome iron transporter 2 [Aspergillus luchuensis]|uniref:Siderochrome iron transporter 2 n=1 Tax=Aspergillus kawachii TaxID=1069201 RepID=A0A146FWS9_ASPKA|nr:siderochrome iron transporter 2 [Aspergillus luchuensis]BCS02666.1 siderochrome iron transporter 2 [Aspergillus luchuensis]BCS14329.1 siderochrome iron transporter 2 [Aspergillus luchuensis]GAT30160.1 siderochrome-iron transporter [Aspergillus luchuensis]
MGVVVDRLKGRKTNHVVDDLQPVEQLPKNSQTDGPSANLGLSEKDTQPERVSQEAPIGVQKAEAAALVWSRKAIYGTYAWIWVCYFMLALHEYISTNVLYYAYSNFSHASQVTTAYILATIIGGVLKLPIGKLLGIWGRAEGLIVFVIVYVLGLIILAACNGPNAFAAGYVFYWIGYDAIYLILEIFIADTSGLRNRAFAFGFSTTPFICCAFTGSLAANSFIKTSGWRWAYGAFAIVQPFVFAPLIFVFKYYERKAYKTGVLVRQDNGRTWFQSLIHYIHEFDVIGAFILMAAFVLFLLPFSLASYGRTEYHNAAFIAEVVIGFVLFFVFAAWERWCARVHFIPYDLLRDRTVLGACLLAAVVYFSFYCWDSYFYYFVMVVYNLDVTKTGYMTSIYTVGSCVWSPVFGFWIRMVKEFKYSCLCFAAPLMFLGAGLMIHFRGQDADIGYVIMCQIFIAFSGGMLVIGQQMAVMCASNRDGIPILLSMLGLFNSIGGAIGYAVSAAIYTNTFTDGLRRALPAEDQDLFETLYSGGYLSQMKYEPGSAVRDAVNYAWGYMEKYEAIAATCILVLMFPAVGMWKHYNVDKKQNKGTMI